jgi:predicted Zn-dependent protease
MRYLTLGHKDEALELLGNIRKRWPEETYLARIHGILLNETGDYQKSIDALKVVVRKDALMKKPQLIFALLKWNQNWIPWLLKENLVQT